MSRLDLKRGLCVRVTPSSLSTNDLKSKLPQSRMDQKNDAVTFTPKKKVTLCHVSASLCPNYLKTTLTSESNGSKNDAVSLRPKK